MIICVTYALSIFSIKRIFFQTLVEFLTKEVTHVISEGPEWKFLSDGSSCGPPSPWTPGASPSPSTSLDVSSNAFFVV